MGKRVAVLSALLALLATFLLAQPVGDIPNMASEDGLPPTVDPTEHIDDRLVSFREWSRRAPGGCRLLSPFARGVGA